MNRFARLIRSAKKPHTKTSNVQRPTFNVQYLTPQSETAAAPTFEVGRLALDVGCFRGVHEIHRSGPQRVAAPIKGRR